MKVVKRKRGERLPPNTVYVGRPTKWGNRFKVGPTMTAERAVSLYASMIPHVKLLDFAELKGKNLACWCGDWKPGEPEIDCHAVVLLKLANNIAG